MNSSGTGVSRARPRPGPGGIATGTARLQPPMTLLPASVTGPLAAVKARPATVALGARAIGASETTVPEKMPLSVAGVGTRHQTLHGSTPLRITLPLAVRALATENT